ncbi:MAG: LLM class flavin-dependent oxidoreductase [Rhodopila sp.]
MSLRCARRDTGLEAMKAIWIQETAEYNGEIVKVPPMQTWPKPVQKPHPPILVGGAFPWTAKRAIRYGDGWYPTPAAATPTTICPASARWPPRPGAICSLCR